MSAVAPARPDAVHTASPGGLHVLFVADVPQSATAGMSGFMISSAAEMERRGNRVTFWFRDQLAPGLAHPGMRRLFVPWLIVLKVLLARHRREDIDVVEIHEPLSAAYGLVARLVGPRVPALAARSHGLEERAWQAHLTHQRVHGQTTATRSRILVPLTLLSQARVGLRAADAVLVPSHADRDYLIDQLGVPAERVSWSHGGVSADFFDVRRTTHTGTRLLFLGTWIERKGTLELIAAWRRLAADRPDVHLTIAGSGDAERARHDTRDLPRVEVIPAVERDELAHLLASHDVFLLPSSFEGMPLAMLEAAAAGLACVVCSVCGNLDVFRPDNPQRDGAILIPPHDAEALYDAMTALAGDPELRAALGSRARERARFFSWSASAERALAAYRAALERRQRRPAGVARLGRSDCRSMTLVRPRGGPQCG